MRPKGDSFSLVIPAYNEEKRIEDVLKAYKDVADEVIVVANGCTDATVEIVGKFSKKYPNIKLVVFEEKLGKGGAVIEGFRKASHSIVGFVDSDLSVPPEELKRLVRILKSGEFAGVIGSRRAEGSEIVIKQPFFRRLSSRIFNLLVRTLFGLKFKDTQCGAKIFRKSAIDAVIDSIYTKGYEFDVELLWKLDKKGFVIKEVGIRWRHSGESKFRLSYGPEMLINLLRIRFFSK
jgi:glycosyltransferase involved in cell wall biosynthesis